jgi:hypothetical protein
VARRQRVSDGDGEQGPTGELVRPSSPADQ